VSQLDSMLKRNKEIAARESASGELMPSLPSAMANCKAFVLACTDMRTDPVQVFGLKLGEVAVLRNIGGRVTPSVLEQLGLLGQIGADIKTSPGGGGEYHLIVMHHTDCGMTRLAANPAALARYFQVSEAEVKQKAVGDPRAAIAVDVAALRAVPGLPAGWMLSGLLYDVATGLVEVVVPAAPVRQG
jgi:carbonic anhydrase